MDLDVGVGPSGIIVVDLAAAWINHGALNAEQVKNRLRRPSSEQADSRQQFERAGRKDAVDNFAAKNAPLRDDVSGGSIPRSAPKVPSDPGPDGKMSGSISKGSWADREPNFEHKKSCTKDSCFPAVSTTAYQQWSTSSSRHSSIERGPLFGVQSREHGRVPNGVVQSA